MNGRSCCQYADEAAAKYHADSVNAEVKLRPYKPQYWKTIKVRGGQERTKLFGVQQAKCSQQLAKAENQN